MTSVATRTQLDAYGEGARLFAAGDYAGASEWFAAALQSNPRHVGALCGLGELCELAGQTEKAAQLYRAASRAGAANAQPWFKLAALLARSNAEEAVVAYEQARLRSPNDVAILRDFGNLLRISGRAAEAETILRHAAFVAPDDLQVAVYLGATYLAAGRFEEALSLFDRVRSRAPQLPEPAYFAALCLQSLRRHEEAADVLRRLTAAHTPTKDWLKALGHSLFNLGRWPDAIEAHTAALRLDPADDDSAIRVADGYAMLPDYAKALRIVDDVLERSPRHPSAMRLKVQLLQCFERHEDALALCEQLLAADPDDDFAHAQRVSIRQRRCWWQDHETFVSGLSAYLTRATASGRPIQVTVQDLHNLPLAWEQIAAVARQRAALVEADAAPARARLGFAYARSDRGRKLRIGYLLPYTRQEAFTMLHRGVVEHHDRDRFELYGYSIAPSDGSVFDVGYRACFDRFTDVTVQAPEAAAQAIHADGIDLLLDPNGHVRDNVQAIVALRPAAVHAQIFGASTTTGSTYVDYLVSDRTFMAPAFAAHCSETMVYLPDGHMVGYQPQASDRVFTRAELGLPQDGFVFACFNQPFKFDPTMFATWMRVLARVPGSALWLGGWTGAARRNLCATAEEHGVDPRRLVFSDIVAHADHLARLPLADLVLDTRHHGGGATTIDALWMGVPLLTCSGDTPASNQGALFAGAMGMPEMAVTSLAAFEERAVLLATDRASCKALRAAVEAKRRTAPLFDQHRFTRHFESAITAMWEQSQKGRRATIDVAVIP